MQFFPLAQAPGDHATFEVATRGRTGVVMVLFLGGVTFAECSALRFVAAKLRKSAAPCSLACPEPAHMAHARSHNSRQNQTQVQWRSADKLGPVLSPGLMRLAFST